MPQLLLQELLPTAGLIILSALGLAAGGAVGAKVIGMHPVLGAAAGVGIMFGFPGVLIVSTEVSKRIARNDEEREFIFPKAAPPMFIGAVSGFFVGPGITVAFLLNYLA